MTDALTKDVKDVVDKVDVGPPASTGEAATPEYPSLTAARAASAARLADRLVDVAQPDAAALTAIMALADSSVQDRRLLSTAGLLEVIRTLNIPFKSETLSFDSLAALEGVLAELPRGQALLAGALTVVAHGNLALESGKTPAVVLSLVDDPITAYLGCLQFLEYWIDTYAESSESADDQGDPALHLMLAMAHAANRKEAEEKVASLLAGQVTKLQIAGEAQPLELVQPSTTVLVLHERSGKETGHLGTFKVREVSLAEAPELASMPMLSHPSEPFPFPSNLRAALFHESEYPDQTVVDRAKVTHIVGVAPMQGEEPIYFKVGVEIDGEAYKIEIATAERWHTRGKDIRFERGRKKRQVIIEVPSQVGSDVLELFMAQTEGALGPQRRKVLERIGESASQSVIIVLEPYISPPKAIFRGKVIAFKQSPQGDSDIQRIADAIVNDKGADTIDWLNENGWLGDKEPQVRRACDMLERIKRQSEIPWLSYSSGPPSKGGLEDLLGYGLSVGASGVPGGRMGISYEKYGVDPLTPPEIIVLRVIGVQGGGEV